MWNGTNSSGTLAVKSKYSNHLGIFDLSGNVAEHCFDWETVDTSRVLMGGGSNYNTSQIQLGVVDYLFPYSTSITCGFRIAHNP